MSLPEPDELDLLVPDSPDQEHKRRKPRRPALTPKEQMARAEMVMAKRLTRQPINEVMEDLGISRATYYRALSMARKNELYGSAKDFLLEDLLPRALRVYAIALEANDIEVARDIINGLGLLGKTVNVNPGLAEGESVTFERWRMSRGASAGPHEAVHPGRTPEAAPPDYIDVPSLPDAPPLSAPPTESGDDEDRLPREGLRGLPPLTPTSPEGDSRE